ncbi:fructokinase [Shewanella gaetbuli]
MRIGIDLGGTKIEAVALSQQGLELHRKRVVTPKTYPEIVNAIVGLIEDAEQITQQTGTVGIGIPGIVSSVTQKVKNSNTTCLNGKMLTHDLENRLKRSVRITNDANCFAVSEATDGAARGYSVVFGAILGTGCGGGVVFNGQVHNGRNGIAAEWGHNPLPWLTDADKHDTCCFCGAEHCIETFVSGTGFLRDFHALGGKAQGCEDIIALVEQGDSTAIQAFDRFIDRLSRGLAQVINTIDPDIIVLGGGLSQVDRIYDALPQCLPQYVLGKECSTQIVKNVFGASSGVRGAAWLWPEQ